MAAFLKFWVNRTPLQGGIDLRRNTSVERWCHSARISTRWRFGEFEQHGDEEEFVVPKWLVMCQNTSATSDSLCVHVARGQHLIDMFNYGFVWWHIDVRRSISRSIGFVPQLRRVFAHLKSPPTKMSQEFVSNWRWHWAMSLERGSELVDGRWHVFA